MNSNVENLPPHIIRQVYKEVSTLTSDPPEGIKIFPNEEDITDVQVSIEGPDVRLHEVPRLGLYRAGMIEMLFLNHCRTPIHAVNLGLQSFTGLCAETSKGSLPPKMKRPYEGTPYAGGIFRMKLILGKDFPAAPPKGYFLTKIFHPNISSNGEICVNVLKKDWKAELGIRHILLTIKCLLIHPNPESALNEEAGRLLLENYEEYASRAKLMTEIHAQASSFRNKDSTDPCSSSATVANGDGPMAKKHAGDRDKKLAAKKKTDKKRALRRL
uniref:UBC core domain-containing protein n=1 Tax=Leptobrachium leishanense TaxID=445787 RepID=A0A8C5MRU7_9ANUR